MADAVVSCNGELAGCERIQFRQFAYMLHSLIAMNRKVPTTPAESILVNWTVPLLP